MVTIRPATPEDKIGKLMMNATGDIGQVMLGTHNKKKISQGMQYLFEKKGNRFSYETTYIATDANKILGFISCMPVEQLIQTTNKTTLDIIKWKKLGAVLHAISKLKDIIGLATMKEGKRGEYHICLIAVDQTAQGKGIATKMLKYAEQSAIDGNFDIASLTVAKDNHGARKLYQKNGYVVIGEISQPIPLYRMQKPLK